MRALDVGIIGGGTAGSAAAIFLARAGHKVTIYERVPEPKPVGAGITIQPTGLHVLCKLGLYTRITGSGARINSLLCQTKTGKALVDLSYESVGPGLFGVGLHRGVLFDALHGTARAEANITIETGVEVVDLVRADGNLDARGYGGKRHGKPGRWTWLITKGRDLLGPHELVIVADGARSQLRDDTSTSKRVEPYPWGALWFVAHDTRPTSDPHTSQLRQFVDGNQRMCGLLPTGKPPGGKDASARLVSLFWSLRADRFAEWRARGLDAWKDEVRAVTKEAEPFLDQIGDIDEVLFANYHDVVMHRWTTRNVVYLGDAAHATSPQLGQGCNLALWDAMTLANCIAAEESHLASALETYTRTRRDHLAFYQLATRWLTPFFQGDVELLGQLRDLGMPVMTKLRFTNRVMTLAMLGVIDGFAGRTLTLRLPRTTSPEPVTTAF